MTITEFIERYHPCLEFVEWIGSRTLLQAWNEYNEVGWLLWAAPYLGASDKQLRKIACRLVRETPLDDGRKVWDLLTDKRSRNAIEIAELYSDDKATFGELILACDAAHDACDAVYDTARDAAYAAARDAAYAACDAAQCVIIRATLGDLPGLI